MAKKTPRKLPMFMQRPIPDTPEGIAQENFRVFAKWALSTNETAVETAKEEAKKKQEQRAKERAANKAAKNKED